MIAAILDTETTGIESPALVEAAWLAIASPLALVTAAEFCGRFNPGKPIEFGAMATHHITNEDIAGAPSPATFALPDGCEYIIGHNIDFDWKVIGEPKVKRICTLAFSRKLWPDGAHSLGAMLYRLEGPSARERLLNGHSAAVDVHNCRILLGHILSNLNWVRTWDELYQQCEIARIPDVMPFGKHKGTRLKDVPADYKQWLLKQPDVDPYLVKALRA